MKILIYLEPHPIRDRFESFGFIGQRFIRMLRDEYCGRTNSGCEPHEVRILLSRHYSMLRDNNKDMAPLFLGLTQDENDSIQSLNRDWSKDPAAIAEWVNLMRGESAVSELYMGILKRVHSEVYPFDVVVNWSTNGAVRRFCAERGLDTVSMELGCTRQPVYDSIYVDAAGVNGQAVSRHVDLSRVTPLDLELIRAMLPTRTAGSRAWDAMHNAIVSKSAESIYQDIGNNVLIPLQLKDDSNCILYSQFESMQQMLGVVLPQLTAAGYRCFVKPHPAAGDRAINKADHDACLAFVEGFESGVFWLEDVRQKEDYLALLNKMSYVVTINSSTGFEAMICGKIVVPLGESPYFIGQAFPTLDAMVLRQVDVDAYHDSAVRIVTVMLRHYLVPQALAFDYPHFIRYLQRAIRANDLLGTAGPSAMTDYLMSEEYLTFDIQERLLAARELHARFVKARPKLTSEAATHKAQHRTTPTAQGTSDAFARKLRKLRRDPAKFLVDSRNPVFKSVGRMLGGRS